MNMASTRSHCIFTIHMTSREVGGDTIRKSKLHLVDLAGYVVVVLASCSTLITLCLEVAIVKLYSQDEECFA